MVSLKCDTSRLSLDKDLFDVLTPSNLIDADDYLSLPSLHPVYAITRHECDHRGIDGVSETFLHHCLDLDQPSLNISSRVLWIDHFMSNLIIGEVKSFI